jgi:2-dehydropantoate 2-reductase
MKIVIFGSGAIGSLFGSLLNKNNSIILFGRKPHVDIIKKEGLTITGKTIFNGKIQTTSDINDIDIKPDLILLTVKSYDTNNAIKQMKKIVYKNTIILTIQNGLDNLEKLKKIFNNKQILAGITTEGSLFVEPGLIKHTGRGVTIIGELDGKDSYRINKIVDLFNDSGIYSIKTNNILREIWKKAIINSCINPLTTIFKCKNGYLMDNPILFKTVKLICYESTNIAIKLGYDINQVNMFLETVDIIEKTRHNYSSMYQSYFKNKKTEIESINGKFMYIGNKMNIDVSLNEILVNLVNSLK